MFKLSIIIPIYNVEHYIQECLESVINQITPDVQIICINDGTPDKSMEIARETIEYHYPEVRKQFLFIDQENQGLSGARNKGISLATGEYIGFLDSDDMLLPNYFSTIITTLSKDSFDIIAFNIITSSNKILKTHDKSIESAFSLMNWFCPARIYKKDFLKNYSFTLDIYYEDINLIPKLYLATNSILHIDLPLYWYRQNMQSITRSTSDKGNKKLIQSLEFVLIDYLNLYKNTLNNYYAILVVQCYFLLCIAAHRRFSLKTAVLFVDKYKKEIRAINIRELPINYKLVDTKMFYFFKCPKLYLYAYNIFTSLK